MNNKGFTLIELIVVIVILGILAVTAVPKYINLKADAQTSTLHGVKAAMEGASALVYGKSIVKGNHKLPASGDPAVEPTVEIADGVSVSLNYGHPTISVSEWRDHLLELDLTVFAITNTIDSAVAVYLKENDAPLSFMQPCLSYYRSPDDEGEKPLMGTNPCS